MTITIADIGVVIALLVMLAIHRLVREEAFYVGAFWPWFWLMGIMILILIHAVLTPGFGY